MKRFELRISDDLHADLVDMAKHDRTSLNFFILGILEAHQRRHAPRLIWAYECSLHARIDTGQCELRAYDPNSRGAHLFMPGCASCIARIATNQETFDLDRAFPNRA